MSGKIRSKDLAYDPALPPFLQRLRDQNTGTGDADRHERAIARPKRAKDPNEDDGPTVVDESGETMTQKDFEKRVATEDCVVQAEPEAATAGGPSKRIDQHVTDGTTSKKRKAVKVVADDAQEPINEDPKPIKKAKKKAKAIKLAFEAEDE